NTVDIEEESEEPEESTVTATHVDEDGEELADSEETSGEEGESYETEEADIDGYTLKEVNGDEEGEYGEDDATVEYVYEKEESEEPELELNGDEETTVDYGESYEDEGAVATVDGEEDEDATGDIETAIEYDGDEVEEVDTEEPGDYEITYTLGDEEVSRAVTVEESDENGENGDDGDEGSYGVDESDSEDGYYVLSGEYGSEDTVR